MLQSPPGISKPLENARPQGTAFNLDEILGLPEPLVAKPPSTEGDLGVALPLFMRKSKRKP
jgi:hypothetical protein